MTAAGDVASSTDPATWCSYREAKASNAGVGLGFALDGDGIVCLDLDHCLVDGQLVERAARLMATWPSTYTEISPSGTGLHVWGFGHLPRGRRLVVDGQPVEAYGTGRYIAMTGERWSTTTQFADLTEVLAAL